MPDADVIEAVAGRLLMFGVAAFLSYLAWLLAYSLAVKDGLRVKHVLGYALAAGAIGAWAAGSLGTVRESDGDPFRPTYDVYADPDRQPPTPYERRVHGWTVFALIAIPAAFGFASGRKAHPREQNQRLDAERRPVAKPPSYNAYRSSSDREPSVNVPGRHRNRACQCFR